MQKNTVNKNYIWKSGKLVWNLFHISGEKNSIWEKLVSSEMKNLFDIGEYYKIVWYCASSSINVWRLNFNLCDMAHVMLIITIHSSTFTTFQENWTQWQCCWWSEKYLIISFSWVFSWIKIRHIARRFDLRKKLFSHLLKMAFSNFFFGWLETERRCL